MRTRHISPLSDEKGSSLIASLLIMAILALLGIASMQTSTMQEMMAGNLRLRESAFQRAEEALRAGESEIAGWAVTPSFDGTNGKYQPADIFAGQDQRWDTIDWDSSAASSAGATDDDSNVVAKYIIEDMGSAAAASDSLAADEALPDTGIYRITARGERGNAAVTLQSTYQR